MGGCRRACGCCAAVVRLLIGKDGIVDATYMGG